MLPFWADQEPLKTRCSAEICLRQARDYGRLKSRFTVKGWLTLPSPRSEQGPTDADRQVFLELRRRYPDLKPSIAGLLFGQYERYQGEVAETYGKPGVPTLAQPEEIWGHASLEGFRIEKGPNSSIPSLRLAYTFEWDEFRLFYVYLWDWEVVRVEEDHG